MNLSEKGLALIKEFEGFRSHVYKDGIGLPTIGYGHKLMPGDTFPNGVTDGQATVLLADDTQDAVEGVNHALKAPVKQGVFDALVSLAYNNGVHRVVASSLMQLVNAGNFDAACAQLYYTDSQGAQHGWIFAGGVIEPGLVKRRQAEQAIWRSV
jgi:lysozyme